MTMGLTRPKPARDYLVGVPERPSLLQFGKDLRCAAACHNGVAERIGACRNLGNSGKAPRHVFMYPIEIKQGLQTNPHHDLYAKRTRAADPPTGPRGDSRSFACQALSMCHGCRKRVANPARDFRKLLSSVRGTRQSDDAYALQAETCSSWEAIAWGLRAASLIRSSKATMIQLARREDPPAERNGVVSPVRGMRRVTPPMMMKH